MRRHGLGDSLQTEIFLCLLDAKDPVSSFNNHEGFLSLQRIIILQNAQYIT